MYPTEAFKKRNKKVPKTDFIDGNKGMGFGTIKPDSSVPKTDSVEDKPLPSIDTRIEQKLDNSPKALRIRKLLQDAKKKEGELRGPSGVKDMAEKAFSGTNLVKAEETRDKMNLNNMERRYENYEKRMKERAKAKSKK